MRYLLLVLVLLLPACVSSRLAEANLSAVTALGEIAVAEDQANIPAAESAVVTAEALVEATGTLSQITSLGVPTELVDDNAANVRLLVLKVTATEPATPEEAAVVEKAERVSAELGGRAHSGASFKAAAKQTPIGTTIVGALEAAGALVGLVYGATRGRKHVAEWWKSPPPALPTDAPPAAGGSA